MAIGPYWHVLLPVEKTNLIENPSCEYGTTGWDGVLGGIVGSTSAFQQFGAWCGSVDVSDNIFAGGHFGSWQAGSGTTYTISLYARLAAGRNYNMVITDTSDNLVSTLNSGKAGGGTWHRYSVPYTAEASAARRVSIRKDAHNSTTAIYVDAVQVEVGSLTTYIDGDQPGCSWTGAPHNSTSLRSGLSRAGGSVVSLQSLGMLIDEEPGAGMPPLENSAQSYSLVPGAEFQRQRAGVRPLTLQATFLGTSWTDLHITRRRVLNALKIDAVTPQQPTRFWYTGGEGTVQIDAVLDNGGELAGRDGFSEITSMRFLAYDPFWYSTTEEGTALLPRVSLGSANFVAWRNPLGKWGTFGAAGVTVAGSVGVETRVFALAETNGTLFVGGDYLTAGGTTSPCLAYLLPSVNRWGTLGGTVDASVRAMVIDPNKQLIFGGEFQTAGGTTVRHIARWNGAFGSFVGGTIDGPVYALCYSSLGTIFIGGGFGKAGGTTAPLAAQHNGAAWGTLIGQAGGTIIGVNVLAITEALDRKVLFGGGLSAAGGTTCGNIFQWNGAFGSVGGGVTGGGAIRALVTESDGDIIAAGVFTAIGGVDSGGIGRWSGIQWTGLGSGVTGANAEVYAVVVDPPTSDVNVGGIFGTAGGIPVPDGLAIFKNSSWGALDINVAGAGTILALARSPDRSLYIGGNFAGTAVAASVGTIINTGMAEAYPIFVARNIGTEAARLYQIANTLTGDRIGFNISLLAGESVKLNLTPGQRSFTSSFRGNVFGYIIGGSNIATMRLLPGTNYISCFADTHPNNMQISLYWRPRHWSADGGTAT